MLLTVCIGRTNAAMRLTRVLCVVGMHRWQWLKTDDGERYRRCRRCGKDDPNIPWIRSASGLDNAAWPR
jgi:hypothetical protein